MAEVNEKEDKNRKTRPRERARGENINNQLRIEALTLL